MGYFAYLSELIGHGINKIYPFKFRFGLIGSVRGLGFKHSISCSKHFRQIEIIVYDKYKRMDQNTCQWYIKRSLFDCTSLKKCCLLVVNKIKSNSSEEDPRKMLWCNEESGLQIN